MIVHIVTHIFASHKYLNFPHVLPPSDQWVATMNASCGVVDAYFIHDQNETIESEWFRIANDLNVKSTYVSDLDECRRSNASCIQYDIIRGVCTTGVCMTGSNGRSQRQLSGLFRYTREYTLSDRRAIVQLALDTCD